MRSHVPGEGAVVATRHRRHPVLVALSSVVLLAACTPAPGGTRPAGLDEFYEQQISWETCDDYATTSIETAVYSAASTAECGRLVVPLNHQDPTGRTARLAVMRVPARGEPIGILVINPGGSAGRGQVGADHAVAADYLINLEVPPEGATCAL